MTTHKIDQILSGDGELIPSSGFLSAVMQRVEEEAVAPPPIPFPWKRAIPGFVLAAGVFGWGGVELVRYGAAARQFSLSQLHPSVAVPHSVEQAGWIVVALGVSLASWLFSRRLAGRSGLL